MIKIRYLDECIGNCRPHHKCGSDPVTASLILGGTSLFSSFLGSSESENAMQTNIEENEKNRKFNREQAETTRQWQTAEREASQGYQSAEWDRRNEIEFQTWLRQNEYNSPQNQVKRLMQAGYNPSAMIGGSAEGLIDSSSLQPSVTPVSAPSSSPASVSTPNPVQAVQGSQAVSSLLSSVGSLISDTARAGKENAEARQLNATLTSVVKEYAEKIKSFQLENDLKELEKYRQSSTMPASIGKAFAELDKLQADIIISRRTGDLIDAQTYTEKMRKVLMDVDFDLKDQEVQKGLIFLDKYGKILDSQINESQSRAAFNYAGAYERTEAAKLHIEEQEFKKMDTDLLSLKKVFQTLDNGLKANEFKSSSLGLERKELEQLIYMIQESEKLDDIKDNWNLWNKVRRVKNLLGFDMSVGASIHN